MSYRIHLYKSSKDLQTTKQLILKSREDEYDKHYNDPKCLKYIAEIWDESLGWVENGEEINPDDEYPITVIFKEDLLNIIKGYQKNLARELKEGDLDDNFELRREATSNQIKGIYISAFFQKCLDKNKFIVDSGWFVLQYFRLLEIYKRMKRTGFLIVRHG